MAEAALPRPCPDCAATSPRVMLTAPRLSGLSAARRAAYATNERSANAPRVSGAKHAPGCSCCSGLSCRSAKTTAGGPPAAKSFPTARPWMISH